MRVALLLALGALAAAPSAADAASLRVSPANTVRYIAAKSEPNRLVVSRQPGLLVFADPGARITPRAPCRPLTGGSAACPDGGIGRLAVSLRDGADSADLSAAGVAATVNGNDGNDSLTGSDLGDRLSGNAGEDRLDGRGGPDRLSGGSGGADTVTYESRTAGVRVSFDGVADDGQPGEGDNVLNDVQRVIGGTGNDSFSAIAGAKRISGRGGDDSLSGGSGDDTLSGGEGNDLIDGRIGSDTIDGGAGVDMADYLSSFDRAEIDLAAGTALVIHGSAAHGARDLDHLARIENVTGTPYGDVIRGDAGPNILVGGPGGDLLDGYLGPDLLVGGSGRDTADYSRRRQPLTVTLDGQTGDGAAGEGDGVDPSVENVTGGAGRDTLVGSRRGNVLVGGGGADTLRGEEGNDRLVGGRRADRLEGGSGGDSLSGLAGNDVLLGGAGGDSLRGGTGSDRLDPGPGPDFVFGGPGGDILNLVDGRVDVAYCGPGRERGRADRRDRLHACARVRQ